MFATNSPKYQIKRKFLIENPIMKTRTSPLWNVFDSFSGSGTTNIISIPRSDTVLGVIAMRPNTLNVSRDKSNSDTKKFIR